MSATKLTAALAAAALLALAQGAAAQQPAAPKPEPAPSAAEQKAAASQTTAAPATAAAPPASVAPGAAELKDARAMVLQDQRQPLNNAPVWSEVRSGVPQYTSIPGREAGILIQSSGETWREARVPIAFWGGILVALAVLGLAGFYLLKGTMTVESRSTGRLIQRFTPADRYAHWLMAIAWVILGITGLILSLGKSVLLPVIGYTLFSWLATAAKNLHNFVGPILIVAIPWMFIRFVRHNGIGVEDVKWFLNIGNYFKGHEYPSGKFNAGEKIVFWLLLVVLSTVLLVTGLVLNFPNFGQTRQTMQLMNIIHMASAYVAIALACVHIYLGTLGMAGAYKAMRYGYVDETWAEHHHKRWYDDVKAGKAREKFVSRDQVPAEVWTEIEGAARPAAA
ncbi:MAG: formate dehydrogenase subunit gamma [Burkholderiales bacterium]|nr:formate dehydrogenase subunit gamma [Burkholderiales bacterium]